MILLRQSEAIEAFVLCARFLAYHHPKLLFLLLCSKLLGRLHDCHRQKGWMKGSGDDKRKIVE